MFSKVTGPIVAKAAPAILAGRKYSPEIGVVTGLLAMGAAAVLLAKAHKRSDHIHINHELEKEELEVTLAEAEERFGVVLTPKQTAVAQGTVYGKYVLNLVKAYGPSILLGTVGAGLILGAHRIQTKRIQGLGAALVLVQQGFNEYRKRVVAEYGEEADAKMMWGADFQSVTRVGDDGKKHKMRVVKDHEELDPTMYNRIFDDTLRTWNPDPQVNAFVLNSIQTQCNDRLRAQGWVSLNWVYSALGFPEVGYGQLVGWARKQPGADGYISFGLDDAMNANKPGDAPYYLTFNVGGTMWEYID